MLLTIRLIIPNSYWVWYRFYYTTVTRTFKLANLSDTRILKKRNQARIFESWSHQKVNLDDKGKVHIITNTVLTTHLYYSRDLLYEGTTSPTSVQLSTQQKEIEKTLQENLVKERFAAIFVLYEHPEAHIYLL